MLDLQAKAGLNVVGYIGPKTWAAAWSGGAAGTGGRRGAGAGVLAADQRVLRRGQRDGADVAGPAVRRGRRRPASWRASNVSWAAGVTV